MGETKREFFADSHRFSQLLADFRLTLEIKGFGSQFLPFTASLLASLEISFPIPSSGHERFRNAEGSRIPWVIKSGHVRPRQGTEICNFGAPSPLDFLNFPQWMFFPFSPGFCGIQ